MNPKEKNILNEDINNQEQLMAGVINDEER